MKQDREKAPHILNASSNLVGFCFVVLTSLKIFSAHEKNLLDEATLMVLVLFMSSCFFSFMSIRKTGKTGDTLEKIAEYAFAGGLTILFTITLFYTFGLMI
jgi:hypothetical protein